MPDVDAKLLAALRFASLRHSKQRRKDADGSPYVNHLIEVAELLARVGKVRNVDVLTAAILHDTVEDTKTKPTEIEREFGSRVRGLVAEVTDNKRLRKKTRKRLQIEHAPHLSNGAKQIKLADKISNVREIGASPPADWDVTRRREYIDWARAVVDGCRGANPALEKYFDRVARQTRKSLPS